MSSDGWRRMKPRSSQRCAPLLTKPSASTAEQQRRSARRRREGERLDASPAASATCAIGHAEEDDEADCPASAPRAADARPPPNRGRPARSTAIAVTSRRSAARAAARAAAGMSEWPIMRSSVGAAVTWAAAARRRRSGGCAASGSAGALRGRMLAALRSSRCRRYCRPIAPRAPAAPRSPSRWS